MSTSVASQKTVPTTLSIWQILAPHETISFKVGTQEFRIQTSDLTKASTYFATLFSSSSSSLAPPARTSEGAYIVNAPAEAFEHIVWFAMYGMYPLFYQQKCGFDLGKYAGVYFFADYFGVGKLAEWIGEKKYVNAFEYKEIRQPTLLLETWDK